jgi:hypothetical protein
MTKLSHKVDYKALKKEVVMDAHYDSDVDEPQLELISGFTLVTHSVEPWVPLLPLSFFLSHNLPCHS